MKRLSEQRVRLLDHVVVDPDGPWIQDVDFDACTLTGPAVVIMTSDEVVFDSNTLDSAMFWTIDTGRRYIGGIGLRRCRFHGCSFENVGIAGPLEVIEQFFG